MKSKTSVSLLVLVTSMILTGIPAVEAQPDTKILLKIASDAQNQIELQIANMELSDEFKQFLKEGTGEVKLLETAIETDDSDAVKQHFLSAMKVFKKISKMISMQPVTTILESSSPVNNVKGDLDRLEKFANSLQEITKKHNAEIDFSKLNQLFEIAANQINEPEEAQKTINQLKYIILDINKELHKDATQKDIDKARAYAQKYLDLLDKLIADAYNQGVSDDTIQKLEHAREKLVNTSNPDEVIQEVKKIISIKKQLEITKNEQIKSHISQLEKQIDRLSVEKIDTDTVSDLENTMKEIKDLLAYNEYYQA